MINVLSFYSMDRMPFSRSIPTENLFISDNMSEVVSRLTYTAQNNQFAILYGGPGIGKSTAVRRLAAALPSDQYRVIYLADADLTPRGLYRSALEELGQAPEFLKSDAKRKLHLAIKDLQESKGKTTVFIIDEAQSLPSKALEELRFFLNVNSDSESPGAVILAGQPQLMMKLKLTDNESLLGRVNRFAKLEPLNRADTGRYIRKQLEYSGCKVEVFTEKAVDIIYKHTNGVPRIINMLCENCLLYGAQQKKLELDEYSVDTVHASELEAFGYGK